MKAIYLSVFSTTFLLSVLYYLPDRFWNALLNLEIWFKDQVLRGKKRIPFLGEIYLGEELLLGLQESESKIALGLKILPKDLAQYKFYTGLLEQLFEMHRKMGVSIKTFIPEMRKAMKSDIQFERKVFDEFVGAFIQFIVLTCVTWSFVFLSSMLVHIPLNGLITICMLVLQILGAFSFVALLVKIKTKTFYPFAKSIEEIYLFNTLSSVGLPLNEVQSKSRILEGELISNKLFSAQAARVRRLLERQKSTGLPLKEEAMEIIQELWQLQSENFTKFTKKMQAIKFGILALFFLPAYFLYLYSIMQFFMEQ